jgi:cell division protein FtsQ
MARNKPEHIAEARRQLGGAAVRGAIGLAILAGALFLFHRLERFLILDERFQLTAATEYGEDPPGLRIEGVSRASRKAVVQTFHDDLERSVYRVPLDQRRAQLMNIEWVREAAIARLWPNELVVRIEERVPVAFFETSSVGGSKPRIMMIDEDGKILPAPSQMKFRLPVITGFRAEDPPAERRARVQRMTRLMKDLKEYGARVSEVNAEDMDNLKAIVGAPPGAGNRRALMLWLGDRNFHQRIEDFDRSYPEIRKKLPDATTLDLRLDGRISVVGGRGD